MTEENQTPPAQTPSDTATAPAAPDATSHPDGGRGDRPPREGRPERDRGGNRGERGGRGERRHGRERRDHEERTGDRRDHERREGDRRGEPPAAREPQQIQFARALNAGGGGAPRRDPWALIIDLARSADGAMAPLGIKPPKEIERDPIWLDSIQGLPKAVDLMGPVPADGLQTLRDGVARFLTREGVATTEHEVFITRGVQHSLSILTLALVDPGTTVIVETLTRARAIHAFKAAGARVEIAPSDSEGVDPRALDRRLQAGGVRFVYLNPTYREPDDAILFDKRRQEVAEVCARRGVVLVEDDSFRQVYFGAPPPRPIPPPAGLFRVHLIDFEMLVTPNLPVAAMAMPLPMKERLMRFVETNGIRTERIPQEIASRLLNHNGWNVYLDRLRVVLRKRREAWLQGIEGWLKDLVDYHAPRGGHYLWMKLKTGRPTHQLVNVALEHKIAIWPGEIFDPAFGESPWFAVSLLDLAPEEVPEAVNRLKAAIEKLATLPVPRPRPKPQEPKPQAPRPPKPQQAQQQKGQPKQGQQPGGRPQGGKPAGQQGQSGQTGQPGQQPGERRGKKKRRRERIPNAPWIDEPTDDLPDNPPKPGEEPVTIPVIRVEPAPAENGETAPKTPEETPTPES